MRSGLWLALTGAMLALAFGAPGAKAAQSEGGGPNVSYSIWRVDGPTVVARFMLTPREARRLFAPGAPTPMITAVGRAVADQVAVSSAGGPCQPVDQGEDEGRVYTLALNPDMDRFEIIFACPSPDKLLLSDHVLFGRVPSHVNYATVQIGTGRPAFQIFTRDRQSLALPTPPAKLAEVGLVDFFRLGMLAPGRPESLCLVAGVLLLLRRWRDFGAAAGALGLGYLASFALAISGRVTADLHMADAAIGLALALLGAVGLMARPDSLRASRGWRVSGMAAACLVAVALLAAAALRNIPAALVAVGLAAVALAQTRVANGVSWLRWLIWAPVGVLAFLDGLGPAENLAVLEPPTGRLAAVLAGYDLGAAVGLTALAAAVFGVLVLLARWLRPARVLGVDFAGATLVGLGLFWFVSRLYG